MTASTAPGEHDVALGRRRSFFGPLAAPELVPPTIGAQLGVPEQPGRPLLATLVNALRGEKAFLLLDNCEHLVEACATVIHQLLTASPDLRVVATSREPLLIPGEKVWRVPPLGLPEPPLSIEHVATAAAVRLFVDRAHAADSSFHLTQENASAVVDVCRRLSWHGLRLRVHLTVDLDAPLLRPTIGLNERDEAIRWQVGFDELDCGTCTMSWSISRRSPTRSSA